jgi:hypothetical protein
VPLLTKRWREVAALVAPVNITRVPVGSRVI